MTHLLGTCSYCPATVVWAWTGNASIPVNPQPAAHGNVVLIARPGAAPQAVVTSEPHAYPGHARHHAHFTDCPGADQARKPKAKPAAQTETLF